VVVRQRIASQLVSLVFCLSAFAASTARADNLDEAKAAFSAGKEAYLKGDYERALGHFQRANLLAPAPSLSFNMGMTYEKLNRWEEAAAAFERYLEMAGEPQTDDDKKHQAEVRQRITDDRARAQGGGRPPQPPPPSQPPPRQPPPGGYPPGGYPPGGYPPGGYPPGGYPPGGYPPGGYPPGYGYDPYAAYRGANPYVFGQPTLSREQRLAAAKSRLGRGVATLIIGGVFLVTSIALIADGALFAKGGCLYSSGSSLCAIPANHLGNVVEITFGTLFLIAGGVMTPVGAAVTGSAARDVKRYSQPEERPTGASAQATIFNLPALRF
jgi:tetratricopeptide (TPR) repeat protein